MAYKRKTKAPKNIYRGRATKKQRKSPVYKHARKNVNLRRKEKRQGKKPGKLGYHHGRTGVKLRGRGPKKGTVKAPKGGFRWGAGKNPDKAIRKMQAEGRSKQYILQQLAHIEEANQLKRAKTTALGDRTAKADRNLFGKIKVGGWGGSTLSDKAINKNFDRLGFSGDALKNFSKVSGKILEKTGEGLMWGIDKALRPGYGTLNAAVKGVKQGGKRPGDYNFQKAFGQGFHKKKGYDINLGSALMKNINDPVAKGYMKKYPDLTRAIENTANLGFQVGLDPLSYVGVAPLKGAKGLAGSSKYLGAGNIARKIHTPKYTQEALKQVENLSDALSKVPLTRRDFLHTSARKDVWKVKPTGKNKTYTKEDWKKVLTGNMGAKVPDKATAAQLAKHQELVLSSLQRPLNAAINGTRKGLTPSEVQSAKNLQVAFGQNIKQSADEVAETVYRDASKLSPVGSVERLNSIVTPANADEATRLSAWQKIKNVYQKEPTSGEGGWAIKSPKGSSIHSKDPAFETKMKPLVKDSDKADSTAIQQLVTDLTSGRKGKGTITFPAAARRAMLADGVRRTPGQPNPFTLDGFSTWYRPHAKHSNARSKVTPERLAFNRILEEQSGHSFDDIVRFQDEALKGLDQSQAAGRLPTLDQTHKQAIAAAKGDPDKIKIANEAFEEAKQAAKAERTNLRTEAIIEAVRRSAEVDRVGLALRVFNQDVMLIPGSRQLASAMHVANSAPVLSQITGMGHKMFSPIGKMDEPLQDIYAQFVEGTNQLIATDTARLRKLFGEMTETQRQSAWREVLELGSENVTEPMQKAMVEFVESKIMPFLNGSVDFGNGPITRKAIQHYLPKAYKMDSQMLEGSFDSVESVMRAFGKTTNQYVEKKIHSVTGKTVEKIIPEQKMDPGELLWQVRAAIHEAVGWKRYTSAIEEFGIRVDGLAAGSTQDSINALKRKGWKTVDRLNPVKGEAGSHIFPPELVDDIERLSKLFDRQNIHKFVQLFDKATRTWKAAATIYNPGYYTRNAIGETIMGWLGGVTDPRWYSKSASMLRYRAKHNDLMDTYDSHTPLDDALKQGDIMGGKTITTLRDGTPITYDMVYLGYHNEGLVTGFTKSEFRTASDLADHIKLSKGLPNKMFNSTLGKAHQGIRRFGEVAEDHPRMAHYLYALHRAPRGMSFAEASKHAARQVRKYHFDYSDVTEFEKHVMMRLFPFYKWTRKALPVIMETALAQPGKLLTYPKLMNAVSSQADPNYQGDGVLPAYDKNTPPFLKAIMAYPLGTDMEGNQTYLNIATPQFDVFKSLFDPEAAARLMFNPFLKVPLEQLLGHNIGAEFDFDKDGYTTWKERLAGAAQSLPSTKFVSSALTRKKDSIWGEPGNFLGIGMDEKPLSFLTGLGFVENRQFTPSTEFMSKWQQTNMDYQAGNIGYQKKGAEYKNTERLLKKMTNPKNNPYVNEYTEVNLFKKYNPDRYPGADKYIDKWGRLSWPAYNEFARQYTATHSPKEIRRNKVKAETQQIGRNIRKLFPDVDL